ncbi:MAG: hypothetical protein ACRD5F_02455 [Candidatus Acidiferrales bacterium]
MAHYPQEDWADLARGVTGAREPAMQQHLQRCEECRQTLAIWQQVTKMAGQEAAYEPPASAVRVAKSFGATLAPKKKRLLDALVAGLIFDSQAEAALAGIRSAATAPRQLLYRSGEFNIDLRIERETGRERQLLVGQVLSTTGRSVGSIPVALISALGPVSSGVTNEFGEFQLEMEARLRVQLLVWLYGAANLLVPLDVLLAESGEEQAEGQRKLRRGGKA